MIKIKQILNFKQNLYKWINLYLIAIYFIFKDTKHVIVYQKVLNQGNTACTTKEKNIDNILQKSPIPTKVYIRSCESLRFLLKVLILTVFTICEALC